MPDPTSASGPTTILGGTTPPLSSSSPTGSVGATVGTPTSGNLRNIPAPVMPPGVAAALPKKEPEFDLSSLPLPPGIRLSTGSPEPVKPAESPSLSSVVQSGSNLTAALPAKPVTPSVVSPTSVPVSPSAAPSPTTSAGSSAGASAAPSAPPLLKPIASSPAGPVPLPAGVTMAGSSTSPANVVPIPPKPGVAPRPPLVPPTMPTLKPANVVSATPSPIVAKPSIPTPVMPSMPASPAMSISPGVVAGAAAAATVVKPTGVVNASVPGVKPVGATIPVVKPVGTTGSVTTTPASPLKPLPVGVNQKPVQPMLTVPSVGPKPSQPMATVPSVGPKPGMPGVGAPTLGPKPVQPVAAAPAVAPAKPVMVLKPGQLPPLPTTGMRPTGSVPNSNPAPEVPSMGVGLEKQVVPQAQRSGQVMVAMQGKPLTPNAPQPAPAQPAPGTKSAATQVLGKGVVQPAGSLAEDPKQKMSLKATGKPERPSWLKLLLFGVLGLAILGLIGFAASMLLGRSNSADSETATKGSATTPGGGSGTAPKTAQNVTLTYWGLWEPAPVMKEIFEDFQKQNPGVTINYVQQSSKDYRERLQDALQKGTGPDMFRYHATWVPMLATKLSTIPASVMSDQEYKQTFYPSAVQLMNTTKGYVGIPHMYEGLGLYYNKQMFDVAKVTPPRQWSDLEKTAASLTIYKKGKLDRGGIALGTTSNVDNFSDILALLLLQNSADPSKLDSQNAKDAFQYYVNFSKNLKVWDSTMPNSTYAFATEKTAMMIAPSWRAFEVKAINPNLEFAIAPVPQLPGTNTTFASFWVEGVSNTSKAPDVAWKLLKYMSSKEVLQKFSASGAKNTPRLFGEIYPRQDMASLLAADPYVGAYVSDAPKSKSWWLSSRTMDNGINDKIIKYYEDALNAMLSNSGDGTSVLTTAQTGVQQILQSYGLSVKK